MQDRQDRRVLRSRTALMTAAVQLVTERGTTALPVADFADAAGVSRQLVYLQFGDRDGLLVSATAHLVERELLPEVCDAETAPEARMLATTRHFARHRPFYRAMLTGSCAFAMTRTLNKLFGSLMRPSGVREVFGDLDDATAQDLVAMITCGTGAIVNDWLIDANAPLNPEELADRLSRLVQAFTRKRSSPTPRAGGLRRS